MNGTVDDRIVSLQLDNRNFETNANTSMKTIDKLEEKLNFKGLSKGADALSSAVKKIDISPLSKGIQEVHANFSALEVMGVTTITNLTNTAVNAMKRIVSSLTVEPVKEGFKEYEMTLNAVQTTMAGTGKTAKEVEVELKKLDEYADKTVYGTADMLNNLPKFTNAGVDLEKATTAMIGIANATAHAGGDASKASIAFYNLGQAIGTGYLTRMDYNSINNAGIATMEWKEQMVQAAIAQGTLTKVGEDSYKAGNKTLTMQQLFIEGLQEQWATTDVMMKVFGDYGDETTDIGKRAYAAAQDIKTFTMMMESLKATAGTGWKDTWQLIFGDLDSAKEFWTGLTNAISNVINGMDHVRNRILGVALNFKEPWEAITGKLSGLDKIKETIKTVGDLSDKVEYYQDVVTRVWRGDYNNWGDNPDRRDLLTADGYDHRIVQDLVNKGYQYKITVEDIEASYAKFGVAVESSTVKTKETTKSIKDLTDEQLENAGLTEDEIKLYRALSKEADRMGISMEELADRMSEKDGRFLLIDSLKNFADIIKGLAISIKEAYVEIFNPPSLEELGIRLYGVINAINEFSKSLRLTDPETGKLNENGDKLMRTFKGLFALIDIVLTIVGGPVRLAFKALTSILSAFDLNLLDVTAFIGDSIVAFRDWFDSIFDWAAIFKNIVPMLMDAKDALFEWFKGLKTTDDIPSYVFGGLIRGIKNLANTIWDAVSSTFESVVAKIESTFGIDFSSIFASAFEGIKNVISKIESFLNIDFGSIGANISKWFKGLKETENIPLYIIKGLINGLKEGIPKVVSWVLELGKTILKTICKVLGIHSPSVEFFEIGKNIIRGLLDGLKDTISTVWEFIKSIGTGCAEILKNVDIGAIIAAAMSFGMIAVLFKIGNALEALSSPLQILDSFSDAMKSLTFAVKAYAIKSIAIAIAILAASVIAMSFVSPGKLWNAIGAITVLSGVIVGLMIALSKLDGGEDGNKQVVKLTALVMAISVSLLILAVTLKIIESINPDNAVRTFAGFGAILAAMLSVLLIYSSLSKHGVAGSDIAKLGVMLLLMSASMLIMAMVVKMLGGLDLKTIATGGLCIVAFAGLMVGLIAMTKLAGAYIQNLAKTLLAMAASMLIMVLVVKTIAKMEVDDIKKGLQGMLAFSVVIAILVAITQLAGNDAGSIGGCLLAISAAMLIMVLVVKIMARMEPGAIAKGLICVLALSAIIAGLIAITKFAGSDIKGVALTLLTASLAIAVMAAICILMGFMKPEMLQKGLAAVGALSAFVAILVGITYFAKDAKGTLMGISIAIAILAASVIALSFIKPEKLYPAVSAIALLMGMFGLVMVAGKAVNSSWSTLLAMAAVIAVLAAALILMGTLKVNNALASAAALSLLMLAMTAVVVVLSSIGSAASNAIMGILMLLAMAVPLAAFVGVLYLMQGVKNVMPNVEALVILTTAMTVLLLPLSLIGALAPVAIFGVLMLLSMAVPLIAFVGVLAAMQNVKNVMPNVDALIIISTAMTVLMIPLTLIGALAPVAIFGVLMLLAMAVPLIAFVGVLAAMQNVKNVMPNVIALSLLMTVLSGVLTSVSVVAPLALMAVQAIAALTVLMVAIGALVVGIGALMTQFPSLQSFIDTGLPILNKLAHGLGSMIGNLVAGFSEAIATSLPYIGQQLSLFMEAAMPFVNGVKMVDESVLAGVAILTGAILALTAAELITGLMAFMSGGMLSLPMLGLQLAMFMINAMPFIVGASMLNAEMMSGVKTLAETILILTAANLIEGLTGFIAGGSSLEKFGSELGFLGEGLRDFVDTLGAFSDGDAKVVVSAANAIKALACAAKEIPNTGGLLASIVGDNEIGPFAAQFPMLGLGLRGFLDNLGSFGEEQTAVVTAAAEAVKTLASASQEIPNTGGLLGMIVGNNDLGAFASDFPLLGSGLRGFLDNIGTFSDAETETVNAAAEAIKTLAAASKEIPNTGGFLSMIVGDNDLGTFAEQFPSVGKGIADMLDNLGTFGESEMSGVKNTAECVKTLAKVSKEIPNTGGLLAAIVGDNSLSTFATGLGNLGTGIANFAKNSSGVEEAHISNATEAVKQIVALSSLNLSSVGSNLPGFATNLCSFATNIVSFGTTMYGINTKGIEVAIEQSEKLIDFARSYADVEVDSLKTFGESLKTFAKTGARSFVEEFTGEDIAERVRTAVDTMVTSFKLGLDDNRTRVEMSARNLVECVREAFNTKSVLIGCEIAGENLVTGLTNGILKNGHQAAYAAEQVAIAALEAAKEALGIASPSKEFYKVGLWGGEGLVNAFGDYENEAGSAGRNLARASLTGLSNALSKTSALIDSGVEVEPTIKPLLDLSNIESGAQTLNGMFAGKMFTVDTQYAYSASAAMIGSRQNGQTNDVISAINSLGKDIANMPRNNYNIGGVTYEERSDVAEAIMTIVRAMQMEGRM